MFLRLCFSTHATSFSRIGTNGGERIGRKKGEVFVEDLGEVHENRPMGEPGSTSPTPSSRTSEEASSPTLAPTPPPPPPTQTISLVQPSQKKKHKPKVIRVFRSVFRSFPIITPSVCKFPLLPPDANHKNVNSVNNGHKISGTLFGYHKGRVSLSVQENPRCLPSLVVELSMQTNMLQKELSGGMVRIALECEKRPDKDKTKMINEPLWTMYCNGKKSGYGVRREATDEDLYVMELLKAVSMGAGVLPLRSDVDDVDGGELAYMRATFDHVVGSKDSETLYMLSPEGNTGPDLTIFFVRIYLRVPIIATTELVTRNSRAKQILKVLLKLEHMNIIKKWNALKIGNAVAVAHKARLHYYLVCLGSNSHDRVVVVMCSRVSCHYSNLGSLPCLFLS
ncbi:hypothetical protein VNO77_09834 [Canavalia gladiata]|uniref:Uncharacterized protein n=1 Tax=Canavalia gladiata TaxID=3824 RepID=A0AAN9QUF3_CANGL